MRLTLRTLLAYRDDVVEPAQATDLAGKLARSNFAQRLNETLDELSARSTELSEKGDDWPLDENQLAAYFSDSLTPAEMVDFERACVQDDQLLAEVAECHALLSEVDRQPVHVPIAQRWRIAARLTEALGANANGDTAFPRIDAGKSRLADRVRVRASGKRRTVWSRSGVHVTVGHLLAAAVNLAVLILFAIIVMSPEPQPRRPVVLHLELARPAEELPEIISLHTVEVPPASQSVSEELVKTNEIEEMLVKDAEAKMFELMAGAKGEDDEEPDSAEAVDPSNTPTIARNDSTAKGTGSGIAVGGAPGAATSSAPPKPIQYFGVNTTAGSVIYVVDASSSMHGRRTKAATRELHESIRGLAPSQRFNFVFFNDRGKEEWFGEEMVPATEENVRRACRHGIRPQGGTEPQNALQRAIAQRPDIIFFMSDGVIPAETVTLASLTPHGTVIHTICFQAERGERLLRAVADAGRGSYRFID